MSNNQSSNQQPGIIVALESEEWYQELIQECKATIVETGFISALELIKGKWLLGNEILQAKPYFAKKGLSMRKALQHIAADLNKSERSIWDCYQFRKKYPGLVVEENGNYEISIEVFNKYFPKEGKAIRWYLIANKYLPKPQVKKIELPKGKYKTLVIDPPWPIEKILREVRPNQDSVDYPVMSVKEIKDLSIKDLIDQNGCHIYLWTTHKHLPDALESLKVWGVKYQCILTWIKNVGFTPFSWMYSTELVLFGRVGNLDLLEKGVRLDFSAKVREHSRKPNEFYEIAKRVSPVPRIDIFSREKREGFDQYGNEVSKFNKK